MYAMDSTRPSAPVTVSTARLMICWFLLATWLAGSAVLLWRSAWELASAGVYCRSDPQSQGASP
jgi:hypothetical protein